MATEELIKERLAQPEAMEQIADLLAGSGSRLRRRVLAKDLCDRFQFYDERGYRQTNACLKALRWLGSEGRIALAANAPASAARGTSVRLHAVVRLRYSVHHEGHEEVTERNA